MQFVTEHNLLRYVNNDPEEKVLTNICLLRNISQHLASNFHGKSYAQETLAEFNRFLDAIENVNMGETCNDEIIQSIAKAKTVFPKVTRLMEEQVRIMHEFQEYMEKDWQALHPAPEYPARNDDETLNMETFRKYFEQRHRHDAAMDDTHYSVIEGVRREIESYSNFIPLLRQVELQARPLIVLAERTLNCHKSVER